MTENPHDQPTLEDVLPTVEPLNPDRSQHGKMPQLDDDELERRVRQERVALGLEPYDPDDVPDAID